jgi:ABC-2 type transport system permease protein
MNAVLVLTAKGFARFLRMRMAVALTFLGPVAMIYVFGWVFGLNGTNAAPAGIKLGVTNASEHPAARKLVEALRGETAFRVITSFTNPDGTTRPLVESDLRPLIAAGAFRFAVVIPADVVSPENPGLQLKILSDPQNEIETQLVQGLLQKTIFSNVPELLGESLQARAKKAIGPEAARQLDESIAAALAVAFHEDKAEILRRIETGDLGFDRLRRLSATKTPAASAGGDFFSRLVRIENEQVVGQDVRSPTATRVVGGWAVMFLMFALNGAATSLFEDKKSGMLQRLLAAPVTRAQILWSLFFFGLILGLVQLLTIFAVGHLLYGIDVVHHGGNLVLVSVAAAAACTALGMFIASLASSPETAMGLATMVILIMSACGGAWFPLSFMPEIIQHVARFTITYWAMDGFAQVLWAGKSLGQILPTIGVLLAFAGGLMGAAIWRFNRGNLFD